MRQLCFDSQVLDKIQNKDYNQKKQVENYTNTFEGVIVENDKIILKSIEDMDIERVSILLSMSRNRDEEKYFKEAFLKVGKMSFIVTEIGGNTEDLRRKLPGLIVSSAINKQVINKKSCEAHALVHATLEASKGLLLDIPAVGNMSLKASIVRSNDWVAVSLFGESAFNILTNHRRVGIGVMHI